jgi:DNA-directed RNA polymerase specialized sigma24 family protein
VTELSTLPREGTAVAELFAAHYLGMVRLAGLLGADDPEDIAQEAFARLHAKQLRLRDDEPAHPPLWLRPPSPQPS